MKWGAILAALLFLLPSAVLGAWTATQSPTGYFVMPVEGTLASAVIAAGALVFYFTRGKKSPKKKKSKKRAR
jgi:hypothetical protein